MLYVYHRMWCGLCHSARIHVIVRALWALIRILAQFIPQIPVMTYILRSKPVFSMHTKHVAFFQKEPSRLNTYFVPTCGNCKETCKGFMQKMISVTFSYSLLDLISSNSFLKVIISMVESTVCFLSRKHLCCCLSSYNGVLVVIFCSLN